MREDLTRRGFLGAAGAAIVAGMAAEALAAEEAPEAKAFKILGVSCSPRPGKTTAAALKVCLEAAEAAGPKVETELVELAGLNIPVFDPAAP
ncbi:MAG: NAD(P)H-dependent oxidoreductase, partial [Phycisphaerae bacterium]